jgi:hypothetical protein
VAGSWFLGFQLEMLVTVWTRVAGGHSGDGELVSASTPGGAAEAALISTLDIARLWTRFKRGARVTDTSIVYKIVEPVVNVAPGMLTG